MPFQFITSCYHEAPPKLPSPGGIEAPPNTGTWFLKPCRVPTPNDTLIGSVNFAGLMVVSNRHTQTNIQIDHATSVAIGHNLCYAQRYGLTKQLQFLFVVKARFKKEIRAYEKFMSINLIHSAICILPSSRQNLCNNDRRIKGKIIKTVLCSTVYIIVHNDICT